MWPLLPALCLLLQFNTYSFQNVSFEVHFEWVYINFTWRSPEEYQEAIRTERYVPQNNQVSGVKAYKNNIYYTLLRSAPGTPVTVGYVPVNSTRNGPLVHPYPSWDMNVGESCTTLQNVEALEIDSTGVMWILDGMRMNDYTHCPPKIVLVDINDNGKVLHSYIVPDELCMAFGGWMNDLVIDEIDGGYAYITDNSYVDPGLSVYSRKLDRGWKLRDRTMYAELFVQGFVVNGIRVERLYNIDGISMSPLTSDCDEERTVYYSSWTGVDIYAISTTILRNESTCLGTDWRRHVRHVGRRQSPSDGMVIDNTGYMYYGDLTRDAISRWNINSNFTTNAAIVYQNSSTVNWADSFGFDQSGYLYANCDDSEYFETQPRPLPVRHNITFRLLRARTGTNSYLYPLRSL